MVNYHIILNRQKVRNEKTFAVSNDTAYLEKGLVFFSNLMVAEKNVRRNVLIKERRLAHRTKERRAMDNL